MSTGRQTYKNVQVAIRDILSASGENSSMAKLNSATPANQRLKMALAQVDRQITLHMSRESAYAATIQKLTEECAERDAKNETVADPQGRVMIEKTKRREYAEKVNELQGVEIDLRVPVITTDEIGDLGVDLSVGDVSALWWLFEEQPYEIAVPETGAEKVTAP